MAYLSKTPNLLEETSRMSPALTRYLENLVRRMFESHSLIFVEYFQTLFLLSPYFPLQNVPEIVCTNCSNTDTVELIRRVSVHLPKTHCDHHIAQLMLDATFIYSASN